MRGGDRRGFTVYHCFRFFISKLAPTPFRAFLTSAYELDNKITLILKLITFRVVLKTFRDSSP